jgi:hypothetical protein
MNIFLRRVVVSADVSLFGLDNMVKDGSTRRSDEDMKSMGKIRDWESQLDDTLSSSLMLLNSLYN